MNAKPSFFLRARPYVIAAAFVTVGCGALQAQLFDELQALYGRLRIPVGDPEIESTVTPEGPKGLADADLDGDGFADLAVANADGTVTLLFGLGPAGGFDPAQHLRTGGRTLRGIVAADFDGNGQPDIAAADPVVGKVFLWLNQGNRAFIEATPIETWVYGGRNLVADDFDGDGNIDLVVGGPLLGLRQYAGDGAGNFTAVTDIAELFFNGDEGQDNDPDELTPVFTLRSFRPVGSTLPKLAATHASTTSLWILGTNAAGVLAIEHVLFDDVGNPDFLPLHDFAIAPVSAPLTSAVPDLLTVSKVRNVVTVWRGAVQPPYFIAQPYQKFPIAAGPRAVKVADMNGDGWGEAVVVERYLDKVVVFNNASGVLQQGEELPTGRSPRDIVLPDLNNDGTPDIAVICRRSMDLTTIVANTDDPGTFAVPRQIYPTDGDVAGLALADMNRDGREDVLQLHRAPGDVSIRLTRSDGSLGPAAFYPMGVRSNGLRVGDVNGDGFPDIVVPNLGLPPVGGGLSFRYGDGAGGLGELRTIVPPTAPGGGTGPAPGMFALVTADIDGDGIQDQVGGYFDCRVSFFRGTAAGTYESTYTTRFVYESRVMVAGDFDQDGDLDIAGVGANGDGVVLINNGSLLTEEGPRHDFKLGSGKNGASSVVVDDVNDDGDPDLILTTYGGVVVLLGTEGVGFEQAASDAAPTVQSLLANTTAYSSSTRGDYDGDGDEDVAFGCAEFSRLEVHTRDASGIFGLALELSVPSAAFLATGDLDGDGLADLVGTGAVLWTALSGGDPPSAPVAELPRPQLGAVVINEVLPKNDSIPVAVDGGRRSDMVEVYNGGLAPVNLQGYRLRLVTAADNATSDFLVPVSAPLAPGARAVFVCSDKSPRAPLHTGFNLPKEGGTLTLTDASGAMVDEVTYPDMDGDISFARFGDAIGTFFFNVYPDPGSRNLDNGVIGPELDYLGIMPRRPAGGEPLRFMARSSDDVGIVSLNVRWRRIDGPGTANGWVPLYDDGMHDDGGMLDGLFAGTLPGGFPDGAQVEFYLVATDLSGEEKVRPGSPLFASAGLPLRNFSLAVGSANAVAAPGLQISEIAASNGGLILDEAAEAEDWIEIRNTGNAPVVLDGLGLAQSSAAASSEVFFFPAGMTLAAGEYALVWADNEPAEGPLHAPFRLSSDGESVYLLGKTDLEAVAVVDAMDWPALPDTETFATLGDTTGAVRTLRPPTPGAANLPSGLALLPSSLFSFRLGDWFDFAFPVPAGVSYTIEKHDPGGPWMPYAGGTGNGAEVLWSESLDGPPSRLFRVRFP